MQGGGGGVLSTLGPTRKAGGGGGAVHLRPNTKTRWVLYGASGPMQRAGRVRGGAI